MDTRMMLAGGHLAERESRAECRRSARRQCHFRELKDFRRRFAVCLDVVDRVIHQQILLLRRNVHQIERKLQSLADLQCPRFQSRILNPNLWLPGEPHNRKRPRMPLFDQAAQGAFDDPLAIVRFYPASADLDGNFRMVFRDIVQVVRHRPADIEFRIILQQLK